MSWPDQISSPLEAKLPPGIEHGGTNVHLHCGGCSLRLHGADDSSVDVMGSWDLQGCSVTPHKILPPFLLTKTLQ